MGKRIVLRTTQVNPVGPAVFEPFEPGKERRHDPRRGGLPRRTQPDRRGPNRLDVPSEQRGGLRRASPDRRRYRDRRFGLDPTLYDRLADLDL